MDYPQKSAPVTYPILPVICDRWSPLAFSAQPLEEEKVHILFEAARWAPSSYNEQPWLYVYAQKDDEGRAAIEGLLSEGNSWAKEAGMLLVQFARSSFEHNGKENRHAMYDCGCATGYLFLQLKELGLIGHEMAGFNWQGAAELLGVPAGYAATAMMAIGYPGDPQVLSSALQERQMSERMRKPQSSFVFRSVYSS